jgi:hypothetical protein
MDVGCAHSRSRVSSQSSILTAESRLSCGCGLRRLSFSGLFSILNPQSSILNPHPYGLDFFAKRQARQERLTGD